jgi:hypothetical protein
MEFVCLFEMGTMVLSSHLVGIFSRKPVPIRVKRRFLYLGGM